MQGGYGLRVAGPTDTKWSSMFTTNLADGYVGYIVPMAFTSRGLRIASAVSDPDGGQQTYLQTTVCK